MTKNTKHFIQNVVLFMLSPFLVFGAIMTYDPEITTFGNWLLILFMSLIALGIWIWDEKKQNKQDTEK